MPNEIYDNLFLTPRETEIYNLMLEGLNVKEIDALCRLMMAKATKKSDKFAYGAYVA